MKIERIWAMPNKETFTIKPIANLLKEETKNKFLPYDFWVDPFCGKNSPACATNDLNRDISANSHLDALVFLKTLKTEQFHGALFDPPYSITQAKQCYAGYGMDKLDTKPTSMKYWGDCKNEIARIIRPEGKVICFGWNSMGLGKNRGFKMTRILLVPHGGSKNDTIITVEIKI